MDQDIHKRLAERDNMTSRSDADTDGVQERIGNLNNGIAKLDAQKRDIEAAIGELYSRHANLRTRAAEQRGESIGHGYNVPAQAPRQPLSDRDRAMESIERMTNERILRSDAADTLDHLLRKADPAGSTARYIAAVANPAYERAFLTYLADPQSGHLRMSAEESEAMRVVAQVQTERAALSLTDANGGYAVPATLDPTVLMTSNGAINPFRQVSSVITIGTDVWHAVSSDGMTVAYSQEATEVAATEPTLAQPTITPARCTGYIPFSIELGQDWSGLAAELVKMLADVKDVVDATQFPTGTGSNAPKGILTSLTASQKIETAGSGAFAIGDNYLLKSGLPARFQGNAVVLANPATFDTIYRQAGGGSTEPPVMPTRDGAWLGRPAYELSN